MKRTRACEHTHSSLWGGSTALGWALRGRLPACLRPPCSNSHTGPQVGASNGCTETVRALSNGWILWHWTWLWNKVLGEACRNCRRENQRRVEISGPQTWVHLCVAAGCGKVLLKQFLIPHSQWREEGERESVCVGVGGPVPALILFQVILMWFKAQLGLLL